MDVFTYFFTGPVLLHVYILMAVLSTFSIQYTIGIGWKKSETVNNELDYKGRMPTSEFIYLKHIASTISIEIIQNPKTKLEVEVRTDAHPVIGYKFHPQNDVDGSKSYHEVSYNVIHAENETLVQFLVGSQVTAEDGYVSQSLCLSLLLLLALGLILGVLLFRQRTPFNRAASQKESTDDPPDSSNKSCISPAVSQNNILNVAREEAEVPCLSPEGSSCTTQQALTCGQPSSVLPIHNISTDPSYHVAGSICKICQRCRYNTITCPAINPNRICVGSGVLHSSHCACSAKHSHSFLLPQKHQKPYSTQNVMYRPFHRNYTSTNMKCDRMCKEERWKRICWTQIAWLIFCVGLIFLVYITMTASHGRSADKHPSVLKVSLPKDTHLRKIRSYSDQPNLDDISIANHSSLPLVTRLQYLDLTSDCQQDLTKCSTHALCDWHNSEVKVICRCQRGYFLQNRICVACSTKCPDGFYMTRKCSAEADVQYKACSQCTGSQYPAAPCTSVQDTICIDVSFPLDQLDSDSMRSLPWRGGVANLSGSENVFVERISKIRRLDTALYLSNNQQSMNFLFQRESGIEVKVKVSDVYLVPEYVDLDHVDDSFYYLHSTSIPEEKKNEFRHTTKHYCRYPLPDYYHMYLQIYLNRSLAARITQCDSRDSNLPRCRGPNQDGDEYLDVLLDTACSQDPGSSISWKSQVNNIICHDNPDILHHVFKLNMKGSSPQTFPSRECQRYRDECLTCLAQNAHTFSGGNNNCSCCNQLKCYNQASCVNLYTPACPSISVKCASADVTKFSIEPRYPSMSEKFMCHLGYLKHRSLYRVYYETTIPKLNFSFETRKWDVLCRNRSFHEDGSDVAEFLHMSHSAQIPIKNEVILEGKYEKNKTNYELHPLKKSWEFHYKKDFEVNQTDKYWYRAKVQFEKPFLYSSSTWQQGGCEKNVSQIHPDQPLYRDHGVMLETPNVKYVDGRFLYPLVANSTPPHIRFFIPENTPILSFYKESLGKSQLIGSSLHGHLNWMANLQTWNITILGVLTSCPSYLTVELYDKYLIGRLDKYEVLVICPMEFTISVQLEDQQANLPDVFVVLINDTMTSHQVVLTSIREPVQLHTTANTEPAVIFHHQSPWIPIIAIIILCSMICIFLLVIYILCDRKRKVRTDITLPKPDLGTTITLLSNTEKTQKEQIMTQTSKFIVVLLLILYMIYALVFTFCTMFGVLYLLQNHSVANLTLVSNTSTKIQNKIQSELQHMKNYERKETLRMLTMIQERHKACAFYLNKSLNDAIQKHQELLRQNLFKIYQLNGTVQLMIEHYLQKMSEHYHKKKMEFVSDFNDTLNKNLHKIHTRYAAYLRKVAENRWLEFPKEVFIHQLYDEGQEVSSVKNKLGEFLTWLEIGEVEEVMGIKDNFVSRLLKLMPKVELSSFLPRASITTSGGARPEDTLQELARDSVPVSWFTFTSHSQESDFFIGRPDQAVFTDIFRQADENTIRNMKQILYPVVIGVFIFLDIFLLAFRFSWALKYLQQFKKGIKESVPTDSITSKIHFILTGIDYKKTDDPFEHPYEFYKENMEELWGEKNELYFLYCQASQRSKEDILREIWSRNHSVKPKTSTVEKKSNCTSTNLTECLKTNMMHLYRLLISRFFWRFILICAFLLFLCLVTKAIDDLVTLEMASFLTDTEAMLKILKRQSEMTNSVIVQYSDHVNKFLREYQTDLDMDLDSLNSLLQEVLTEQTNALNRIVSDLCSLGGDSTCHGSPVAMATFLLTNCQLLSIQPQLYTGFQENIFTDYISSELSPLVTSLRSILFNAFYILLLFAFLMLMCQILARVIYICLLKSSWLHIKRVYQRPSALNQWQEPGQSFRDKTYGSQSLIAESCESGVYET